jgi:NAD(P)-dependent dehydrogenase (short-subunit alcohol dehydrogenase family)
MSLKNRWPMPGTTAYCLAKGGVHMLIRTAGVELDRHDILVIGVGPGAVATPINLSTMKDPASSRRWMRRNHWGALGDRRRLPAWCQPRLFPERDKLVVVAFGLASSHHGHALIR